MTTTINYTCGIQYTTPFIIFLNIMIIILIRAPINSQIDNVLFNLFLPKPFNSFSPEPINLPPHYSSSNAAPTASQLRARTEEDKNKNKNAEL